MGDRLIHMFVLAVFVAFCLSFTLAMIRRALGGADSALESSLGALLVFTLFTIGLVVRIRRWVRMKSAESARRRRAEKWNTAFGSPERLMRPDSGTRQRKRSELRSPREDD